eukprot:g33067.t1
MFQRWIDYESPKSEKSSSKKSSYKQQAAVVQHTMQVEVRVQNVQSEFKKIKMNPDIPLIPVIQEIERKDELSASMDSSEVVLSKLME